MAKAKAKNKKKPAPKAKASKPAKAKGKPVAKKVSKKKPTPKAKKAAKVAKAKVVAKKAAPKKVVAKKPAPKAAPVSKTKVVSKPAPVQNLNNKVETKKATAPVKLSKKDQKRIIREEVKPEPKHFYNTLAVTRPTPQPDTKQKKVKSVKELNMRYSDDELKEFKDLIDKKLAAAREELHNLKETLDNHTESQAGNKAWNMEEGTDTSEMEYLMNQISRQHQYIRNLELALVRVENKTYGICRVTGKLIPKERLRVVPHATLSLEAKISRKPDTEETAAGATAAPPSDFAEGFED